MENFRAGVNAWNGIILAVYLWLEGRWRQRRAAPVKICQWGPKPTTYLCFMAKRYSVLKSGVDVVKVNVRLTACNCITEFNALLGMHDIPLLATHGNNLHLAIRDTWMIEAPEEERQPWTHFHPLVSTSTSWPYTALLGGIHHNPILFGKAAVTRSVLPLSKLLNTKPIKFK